MITILNWSVIETSNLINHCIHSDFTIYFGRSGFSRTITFKIVQARMGRILPFQVRFNPIFGLDKRTQQYDKFGFERRHAPPCTLSDPTLSDPPKELSLCFFLSLGYSSDNDRLHGANRIWKHKHCVTWYLVEV